MSITQTLKNVLSKKMQPQSNADSSQAPVVQGSITVENYTADVSFLRSLLEKAEFNNILKKLGLTRSSGKVHEGGFSVVFDCDNKSVVKLASVRNLFNDDKNTGYVDVSKDYLTENERQQKEIIYANFRRETYAYRYLDAKHRSSLAEPFLIAIVIDGNIYDYLICVNLPFYQTVNSRFSVGSFNEKEVLKMIYDVLKQLQLAHNDGLRHRDIKLENIMYDDELKKYVLIDWGASCKVADNDYAQDSSIRNAGDAFTPVYADPIRFEKKSFAATLDLYSLGVLMTYMAHSSGYSANNSISDFFNACCNAAGSNNDYIKILPDTIHVELENASRQYREIVRKAMNHPRDDEKSYSDDSTCGYKLASEMLNDVERLLGISQKPKKQSSFKTITVRNWYGAFLPFILGIYALALSIASGAGFFKEESSMFMSVCILLLCGFVPLVIIGVKSNFSGWQMDVSVSTLIGIALLFLAISLSCAALLCYLQVPYTLLLCCVHFFAALILYFGVKSIPDTTVCIFLYGTITGIVSGLSIAVCLDAVSSAYCLKITGAAGLLGFSCSLLVWYAKRIYATRVKKIKFSGVD